VETELAWLVAGCNIAAHQSQEVHKLLGGKSGKPGVQQAGYFRLIDL